MLKTFFSAVIIVALVVSAYPKNNNIEEAVRHRHIQTTNQLETSDAAITTSPRHVESATIVTLQNKSAAQLEELGSRYGFIKSTSQLEELGSRYGFIKSTSQLEELGSRYGFIKSTSQLEELGSRYGFIKSTSQLKDLGRRYGFIIST